ncbi:MAG: hypothetical protein PHU53_07725, partial [Thermoplasmata archaeon]|nr:hypothetical protein [Thermoplasmata archaeon]
MEITVTNLKNFRSDFCKAVEQLEKKYNVKVEFGDIKYSTNDFHGKVTVKNLSETGEEIDNSFKDYAGMFGLNPDWQGKTLQPRTGES